MNIQVDVPYGLVDEIMEEIRSTIVARALNVVEEVEGIIKEVAILEEKDVYGQQITPKKPKPPKHPTNLPNAPLIGKPGEHPISMMDPSRFSTEHGDWEAFWRYSPPDYFKYVIEKRPWILQDEINDDARHRCEMRFRELAEGRQ